MEDRRGIKLSSILQAFDDVLTELRQQEQQLKDLADAAGSNKLKAVIKQLERHRASTAGECVSAQETIPF